MAITGLNRHVNVMANVETIYVLSYFHPYNYEFEWQDCCQHNCQNVLEGRAQQNKYSIAV